MNSFVIILLWQHILYLYTLFLVQGGKWTCLPARETTYTNAERQVSPFASLHEKQRVQIQDMLPQQYYNERVHIFNT